MESAHHPMTSRELSKGLPRRMLKSAFGGGMQGTNCCVASIEHKTFSDVASFMQDGDSLHFSGKKLHSYMIRIGTGSLFSHSAMVGINELGRPEVLEVVEGAGGRHSLLEDAVQEYPGQWHWAPAERERFTEYDGKIAAATMWEFVGCPYGRFAICWEACWHVPGMREIAFWRYHTDLDKAFVNRPPYCSMAVSMGATNGGVDPVPGRAPQWTVPQDIAQSLLWSSNKIALWPMEMRNAV